MKNILLRIICKSYTTRPALAGFKTAEKKVKKSQLTFSYLTNYALKAEKDICLF